MDSMWYFNPCFDTKDAAQGSHMEALPSTLFGEDIGGGGLEGHGRHSLEASVLVWDSSFLLRKMSLLLALRKGRRTGLLLDLFSRDGNSFGFHGEDEAGACSEGEGEGSTLAGQSVA